jgi:DNA-binding transcriptional regulator LsrR (DeoR family)
MNHSSQVNQFTVTGFADRINSTLQAQGISQSGLAARLGISRSTLTGWLRYGKLPDGILLARVCDELGISADWLLGMQTQGERQNASGAIRWVEQIPPYVQDFQREQLEQGIQIFRQFVVENRAAAEVRNHYHPQYVRAALQAVLRSGAIRLVSVGRNSDLETELKRRYPSLKTVVVADVPEQYDDTLIRTELVAFLSANEVLSQTIRQSAIGLGSGYTLMRMCENSIPSIDQFSGTNWIPLLAFSRLNRSVYSANDLARLMAARHPGSQALYLPHPEECVAEPSKSIYQETQQAMNNLQTIFVSVSGVDRRDRQGNAHFLAEFRSADYEVEAANLRLEYAALDEKENFGGEVLRYMLDMQGNIIGRDPDAAGQIGLDILRYNSDMVGTVCIVAACGYKAKAVFTCVENRLVNALVIDSEIAQFILAQPTPQP